MEKRLSETCYGCEACKDVCPKKCVTYKKDQYGFRYAFIDSDMCISCNLCKKVCISECKNDLKFSVPLKAFAVLAKNKNILKGCASGGAASILSYTILEVYKGVVYGATVKQGKFFHCRIDDVKDIDIIKGSKYVQSSLENIFFSIKDDLSQGLMCLFVGTPCQVSAMQLYLNNPDNLICVSFPCGGVSSDKFLYEEITCEDVIDRIIFRNRRKAVLHAINKKGIELFYRLREESVFWFAYDLKYSIRQECRECQFSQEKRIEDITIGDFWGYNNDNNIFDKNEVKKGVSFLAYNTPKGEKLFYRAFEFFVNEEVDYKKICECNPRLRITIDNQDIFSKTKYVHFRKLYPSLGLDRTILQINGIRFNWNLFKAYVKYRILKREYR